MNYKVLAEGPIVKRPGMLPCRETLLVVYLPAEEELPLIITSFWVYTALIDGKQGTMQNVETFDTDIRLVEQAYHDAFTRWLKRTGDRVANLAQVINEDTLDLYPTIEG
jgi:hypothetical protein